MALSLTSCELVVWLLATYGMTIILSMSKIFRPIRIQVAHLNPTLGELVSCSMCCGFWIGAGISILGCQVVNPLLDGCIVSGFSWLFSSISNAAEVYVSKNIGGKCS